MKAPKFTYNELKMIRTLILKLQKEVRQDNQKKSSKLPPGTNIRVLTQRFLIEIQDTLIKIEFMLAEAIKEEKKNARRDS